MLHVKIQPFIYEFQNRMEKWLILTNMTLIFAATLYSEFLRSHIKSNSDNVWSWVFSFFLLFLIFGSLLASSIYFHLWRKLYASLMALDRSGLLGVGIFRMLNEIVSLSKVVYSAQ